MSETKRKPGRPAKQNGGTTPKPVSFGATAKPAKATTVTYGPIGGTPTRVKEQVVVNDYEGKDVTVFTVYQQNEQILKLLKKLVK